MRLKDYILLELNTNNSINDELSLHFYAEFVLNESFKQSYFSINEKHGSYIGQKELIIDLAKEIYKTVSNNDPQDVFIYYEDDLSKYSNIFFDMLSIQITNNDTCYKPNLSRYDSDQKKFNKVVIYIKGDDCKNYRNIASALMHELLHAWENYQRYLTNAVPNLKELTGITSRYAKTLLNKGSNYTKDICKEILNNLASWEKNAYINELSIELQKHQFDINAFNTTNEAYKAAVELFKNSDTWIRYYTLWEYLHKLKTDYFGEQDDFVEEYNSINNDKLTFNKIYKKLDDAFLKIFKRIETNIPKIFYDYYQEELTKAAIKEGMMLRHNISLQEFLKWDMANDCLESVKPDNGLEWEVYVDNKLDATFTKYAKKWKKYPKIGQGWYYSGAVFKIVKIEDNKIYVKEDK